MLHWYAVYTHPRAEKKLRDQLAKKNIETYLPLIKTRKKWSDRYQWVEEPVFASYIFVRIDFTADSLAVLRLPQSVKFIGTEGAPTVVSDGDIELLRLAVENFAESLVIRDTATLTAGQKVRVIDGPFAGKEATVERVQGKALVVLSFAALNKSVVVEIPVSMLAKGA
ncbi:MAG: UpxY family transcription antiterminator [Spirochaetes bacterium]|nr:UpxY family transcription antiterminator [Spirochaetota bacterium]